MNTNCAIQTDLMLQVKQMNKEPSRFRYK